MSIVSLEKSTNIVRTASFGVLNISGPGTYTIDSSHALQPGVPGGVGFYFSCDLDDFDQHRDECPTAEVYSTGGEWTVTFTKFTDREMAGTFAFTAEDDEGSEVRITEARFSLVPNALAAVD